MTGAAGNLVPRQEPDSSPCADSNPIRSAMGKRPAPEPSTKSRPVRLGQIRVALFTRLDVTRNRGVIENRWPH